ncbi:MAG: methyltransferase domain-containing protein [Candidatus Saganbacteria bacterium]|nr:methyltransferase domain-containing protein [Candidatus Saganbacteria bacterium]
MSKDTSWNKVAGWYDRLVGERGSDYHEHVIIPGALKLLAPQKGEKIIDLGCGQGVFCRELARAGAAVTGIDSSPSLIKTARRRSPEINYLVADAADLRAFGAKSFDAAACLLALQNMEHCGRVIAEAARLLKPRGRLLIVMNHPCFRIPRQSGWGTDERRKLQYRRIDSYLTAQKIPIKMHPGAAPGVTTWTFHRPLKDYFAACAAPGLAVTRLEEWASHRQSKPGAASRMENRARAEIPMFLALLAVLI